MLSAVAFCLLLLFLCGAHCAFAFNRMDALHPSQSNGAFDYGLMIDAGSSGSRVYVYKWPHRDSKELSWVPPLSEPVTQHGWSEKAGPLSEYAVRPEAVGEMLAVLVDFAEALLSEQGVQDVSSVPLFLGATAGMRVQTAEARQNVMEAVRAYFRDSKFYFRGEYARIISGEEEGVFGWISANYLAGNDLSDPAAVSFGALDMGGASTQITFQPAGGEVLANYFPLHLQTATKSLYTHSFLNFGLNEATARLRRALLDDGTTVSPCLQTGAVVDFPEAGGVNLTGSSDPTACTLRALALLDLDASCWTEAQCGVSGVYLPEIDREWRFYAMSAYAKVFQLAQLDETASLRELGGARDRYCAMSRAELAAVLGESPYLDGACFALAYMHALLTQGYGFPLDDTRISFIEEVDGTDLEWTLGGMLYQSNLLPWSLPQPGVPSGYYRQAGVNAIVGVLASGLLLSLAAVAVLAVLYRRATSSVGEDKGYEHLSASEPV